MSGLGLPLKVFERGLRQRLTRQTLQRQAGCHYVRTTLLRWRWIFGTGLPLRVAGRYLCARQSGHEEPLRRCPDRCHRHGRARLGTTQDTPGESRKELKVTISKRLCSVPCVWQQLWLTTGDCVEGLYKTRVEGIELRSLQSVRSANDL